MNPFIKHAVAGSILMGSLGWAVAHADLNFGVNALRGSADATTAWSEMGKFLSAEIGEPVNLLPLKVTDVVAEVKKEGIDLVLANPMQMVQLKTLANATPLVSLNTKSGVRFAGVIFARKDSGISHASDLKGKKIATMPKAAAGGYIFQVFHLFQKGIDIRKDFAAVRQVQKQDDIVAMVQKSLVDVGFVRSGLLEAMAQEGKITMEEFVIVDQRFDDKFSLVHTTALYPEWYIAATEKTHPTMIHKVKTALLKVSPSSEAAKAAQINGFVEPLGLDELRTVAETIQNTMEPAPSSTPSTTSTVPTGIRR